MSIFGRKKRYSVRNGGGHIVVREFETMEDAALWARHRGPGFSIWHRDHRLWTEGSEGGLSLKETFGTAIGVIRRRNAPL